MWGSMKCAANQGASERGALGYFSFKSIKSSCAPEVVPDGVLVAVQCILLV